MTWKRKLVFLGFLLISMVSGFITVIHFRHEPHWPADRFGGTLGALACIPICLASYALSSYYASKWLHPIVFPRLRAVIPRPQQDHLMKPRQRTLMILGSFLVGTVSGAIIILHFFHQPQWSEDRFGVTPGAVACIPICLVSYNLCFYSVYHWLHAIVFPAARRPAKQPAPAPEPAAIDQNQPQSFNVCLHLSAVSGTNPHRPASGEMFDAHLAELRLVEAVLDQADRWQWDLWDIKIRRRLHRQVVTFSALGNSRAQKEVWRAYPGAVDWLSVLSEAS